MQAEGEPFGDITVNLIDAHEVFRFDLDVTGSRMRPVLVAFVDDPDSCQTVRFAS